MKRWKSDERVRIKKGDGTIIFTSPNRWLASEHADSFEIIYTTDDHGKVIQLDMRITFEDFMARMPKDCLVAQRRGIAVCEKMLSSIDPENRKLSFRNGAEVTLKHKVAEGTMRAIGDH